jgi:hypothetical protein
MEPEQPHPRSHLFMVRLWLEPLGGGQVEWRGKVQHVRSGEARYFRGWPVLQAFLERWLQPFDGAGDAAVQEWQSAKGPGGSS